jgi:ABC-2 type transport system permease protein
MRSFSDEYKSGTIEILLTKPLRKKEIVLGKYFSILLVCLFLITPTSIYVFTIYSLSANGIIDGGGIIGSYFGLFLLSATFAAVSMCCSSLTANAIVAFLMSAFISLFLFVGFGALSKISVFKGTIDYYLEMLGVDFHYMSLSRGVIDTRDVIYFLSIILFSLFVTEKQLQKK